MAERPVFMPTLTEKDLVLEKVIQFQWFPGFAISQKQKSIGSLHERILQEFPSVQILEISSKSRESLGISLSAFNLMIRTKNHKEFSVETAFQASKVFENGGPYLDLYDKSSREAKKDPRIKTSGKLLYFKFFERQWELRPKTLFYDWLYINALALHKEFCDRVINYDAFTDIEFNPDRSLNCQARAAALYVSLYKNNLLERALSSIEEYKSIVVDHVLYRGNVNTRNIDGQGQQLNLFDNLL